MNQDTAIVVYKGVTNNEFDAKFIHHLVFWAIDIHGNQISWCQRESTTPLIEKDV